jgi:hypothetical protein
MLTSQPRTNPAVDPQNLLPSHLHTTTRASLFPVAIISTTSWRATSHPPQESGAPSPSTSPHNSENAPHPVAHLPVPASVVGARISRTTASRRSSLLQTICCFRNRVGRAMMGKDMRRVRGTRRRWHLRCCRRLGGCCLRMGVV